jgi:3-oxoacyl-[acyl-carrier-protein] synthase III
MGTALPGPPVSTTELLTRVEKRFGVAVSRHGCRLARRLGIASRHICRDFAARREAPRQGHSNPDLAAAALRAALHEAHLEVGDLTYLIGHTTSPARLVPPNIALVADRLGFTGPYMELRQACTGFEKRAGDRPGTDLRSRSQSCSDHWFRDWFGVLRPAACW